MKVTLLLCVYCNEREGKTDDHVVSKQLYPKPWPNDFITVPCCEECNKSFQKDEEYFRMAITGSLNAVESSQAAKDVLEGPVIRSFERNPSLVNLIAKDLNYFPVISEDGKDIFFIPGYPIDRKRAYTVVNKIIKGLFYVEKQKPLPQDFLVATYIGLSEDMLNDNMKVYLIHQPVKEIGKSQGVFEYIKLDVENNEFKTFWLICFYKYFLIAAGTVSSDKGYHPW